MMTIKNHRMDAGVLKNGDDENGDEYHGRHAHHHQLDYDNDSCGIKDVWSANLYEEFKEIRKIILKYQYVAMDTEFPGVVARPGGEFKSTNDYHYQLLRCNVDLLKIIQLGLTFLDEYGNTPKGCSTWQFNFKFDLNSDMYAQDSIDLLQNSGIQFKKHQEDGIDPYEFAELLMASGIVLNDEVKWLSFHSGYDFGYLLKMLTDQNLLADENDFFDLLKIYFPCIYDIKYLMKSCKNLKGGLQEVADQLKLKRVGPQHQAGSDSLLTGIAFFKMREMFFGDNIDDSKYAGHLYGLGATFTNNNNNNHNNVNNLNNNNTASTNSNSNNNNNNNAGSNYANDQQSVNNNSNNNNGTSNQGGANDNSTSQTNGNVTTNGPSTGLSLKNNNNAITTSSWSSSIIKQLYTF